MQAIGASFPQMPSSRDSHPHLFFSAAVEELLSVSSPAPPTIFFGFCSNATTCRSAAPFSLSCGVWIYPGSSNFYFFLVFYLVASRFLVSKWYRPFVSIQLWEKENMVAESRSSSAMHQNGCPSFLKKDQKLVCLDYFIKFDIALCY